MSKEQEKIDIVIARFHNTKDFESILACLSYIGCNTDRCYPSENCFIINTGVIMHGSMNPKDCFTLTYSSTWREKYAVYDLEILEERQTFWNRFFEAKKIVDI